MYKSDYTLDDYLRVTDRCGEKLRLLLQTRYNELEELRNTINDRYPFEDLFLKWAEVDDEEFLIQSLLKQLDLCILERKDFNKKAFLRNIVQEEP